VILLQFYGDGSSVTAELSLKEARFLCWELAKRIMIEYMQRVRGK